MARVPAPHLALRPAGLRPETLPQPNHRIGWHRQRTAVGEVHQSEPRLGVRTSQSASLWSRSAHPPSRATARRDLRSWARNQGVDDFFGDQSTIRAERPHPTPWRCRPRLGALARPRGGPARAVALQRVFVPDRPRRWPGTARDPCLLAVPSATGWTPVRVAKPNCRGLQTARRSASDFYPGQQQPRRDRTAQRARPA